MKEESSIHKKMASNAAAGMIATGIYLVSRLLLTPFILSYLTLAEFGLWSLCFIILSYASMGGFGVNSTYIRYTARYSAEGHHEDISKLLSTGIAYMLSFSTLFCLILWGSMPLIHRAFDIEISQQALASSVFLGTAAVFSLELTLGGFRFIITGLHEIAKEKKITTIAGLLEIVAILIFLTLGSGILGLLYAYALRVIIETWSCRKVATTLLPELRVSPSLISREQFRLFFVFGGKVQVLGAAGIFLTALDRLFVTATAGLAAGGMLEIGRKLPFTAKKISESAFGPFLPAAAHFDGSWEREIYNAPVKRLQNYILIILLMIAFGGIPFFFIPSIGTILPFPAPAASAVSALFAAVILVRLIQQQDKNEQLKKGELRELYLQGLRYTTLISATIFGFIIAAATPLIHAWVGSDYNDAIFVMVLIALAYTLQLATGPGNLIFRGIDRNGRELEYLIAQMSLLLLWLPAATVSYGLNGAAVALAAASGGSTIFFFWRSNHTFQIPFSAIVKQAILPAMAPLVPAVLVYCSTTILPSADRLSSILTVLICGILYLSMTLAIIWLAVLNPDEKQTTAAMLGNVSTLKRKQ